MHWICTVCSITPDRRVSQKTSNTDTVFLMCTAWCSIYPRWCLCVLSSQCQAPVTHSHFTSRWISLFDSNPIHHHVYVPLAPCLIRLSAVRTAAAAVVIGHYAVRPCSYNALWISSFVSGVGDPEDVSLPAPAAQNDPRFCFCCRKWDHSSEKKSNGWAVAWTAADWGSVTNMNLHLQRGFKDFARAESMNHP